MDTTAMLERITTLAAKAAAALDSNEALKFSQAACNVANALSVAISARLADAKTPTK